VAKTDEFKDMAHKIAMQVASMNPIYVSEEDIPENLMHEKRAEFTEELKGDKKPEDVKAKIIDGKVKKYFEDKVLLNQPYILDDSKTVNEFVKAGIAKTGENITIRQFKRVELGVSE
jgi:elongation factor Ts